MLLYCPEYIKKQELNSQWFHSSVIVFCTSNVPLAMNDDDCNVHLHSDEWS